MEKRTVTFLAAVLVLCACAAWETPVAGVSDLADGIV